MKFQFFSVYDRRHLASILHAVNYLSWASDPKKKKLWHTSRKYAPLISLAGAALFLLILMTTQNFSALLVSILIFAIGMRINQRPSPTGRAVKQLWRSYQHRGAEMKFCFDDEGIDFYYGGSSEHYTYDQLVYVLEEPHNFFLCFNPRSVGCVLVKREITCGTVDDFRKFIVEKTGKPVEYFK